MIQNDENEITENEQQENQTVATVTEHFKKQLEEEKKKHEEEIKSLQEKLNQEKERHIQDIKDILTVGKITIPQDDERSQTEEDEIINKLRLKFNLKGVK